MYRFALPKIPVTRNGFDVRTDCTGTPYVADNPLPQLLFVPDPAFTGLSFPIKYYARDPNSPGLTTVTIQSQLTSFALVLHNSRSQQDHQLSLVLLLRITLE